MRLSALISIAALFLAGCASTPPIPKIQSASGDRVGVLVEVGDSPSHTHIGTTVFNNFTKKYPYNWKLNSEVSRVVQQSVKSSGFEAIDLNAAGIQYTDVAGLIKANGEQWQVTPGKEDTVRRLREQLKLKALIVLKEERVLAALECAGGPCAERYADTSGLYTRSFLGITRYNAVAAFKWNVFVLDPITNTVGVDSMREILRIPATPLPGFKDPTKFDNLTEAEFVPVRDAILRFTQVTTTEAMNTLNAK
jgi:hypothetical protein